MVTGNPPFYADDLQSMYKNIEEAELEFPEGLSEELQSLIKVSIKKENQKISILKLIYFIFCEFKNLNFLLETYES